MVEAKAGKGSATLSMAYAGAVFADACLRGLMGEKNVVECAFVASTVTELPYFASKVRIGTEGTGGGTCGNVTMLCPQDYYNGRGARLTTTGRCALLEDYIYI